MKKTKATKNKENNSSTKSKKLTLKDQLNLEKDKYLRLFAEFDNFRKRTAKERIDLFTTAGQDIITGLLPILDDLERAIKANDYPEGHGVVLIYNKLKSELDKRGLKEMDNAIGEDIDTDYHEVISKIPATNKKSKGKIVDVVEKGYLLGEKVLRFAKVVVSN
ncbi:MAG: nucleotide exchange factor GrpE [Bacteroidota bacterium]|nr:nucleotide exchange factor GrpE [Bacteroidota bacterium]|tara:strand:- start:204 stop:692 length:489 start_codon:yes stop_codon:yes gene_type:complete